MAEKIVKDSQGLAKDLVNDCISRQAAIDAVKKNTFRLTFAEEQNCEGHLAWSANAVYSDVIEGALLELPSAQPKSYREGAGMDEMISRQAVLKLLSAMPPEEAITKAMLIQSVQQMDAAQPKSYREGYQAGFKDAQPEIIRCRECRYKYGSDCDNFAGVWVKDDDFCSRAERREVSE